MLLQPLQCRPTTTPFRALLHLDEGLEGFLTLTVSGPHTTLTGVATREEPTCFESRHAFSLFSLSVQNGTLKITFFLLGITSDRNQTGTDDAMKNDSPHQSDSSKEMMKHSQLEETRDSPPATRQRLGKSQPAVQEVERRKTTAQKALEEAQALVDETKREVNKREERVNSRKKIY